MALPEAPDAGFLRGQTQGGQPEPSRERDSLCTEDRLPMGRQLPREFPAWSAVYSYFYRWSRYGTWGRLNHAKSYERLTRTDETWIHIAMTRIMSERLA